MRSGDRSSSSTQNNVECTRTGQNASGKHPRAVRFTQAVRPTDAPPPARPYQAPVKLECTASSHDPRNRQHLSCAWERKEVRRVHTTIHTLLPFAL